MEKFPFLFKPSYYAITCNIISRTQKQSGKLTNLGPYNLQYIVRSLKSSYPEKMTIK